MQLPVCFISCLFASSGIMTAPPINEGPGGSGDAAVACEKKLKLTAADEALSLHFRRLRPSKAGRTIHHRTRQGARVHANIEKGGHQIEGILHQLPLLVRVHGGETSRRRCGRPTARVRNVGRDFPTLHVALPHRV